MNYKKNTHYDVALTGLGMSGLSLATNLSINNLKSKKIVLIDQRKKYLKDKSWCYWQTNKTIFDSAITHKWNRWVIKNKNKKIVIENHDFPYVYIDSEIYYKKAFEIIKTSPLFDIYLDTKINKLQKKNNSILISTNKDEFEVNNIFDSRPRQIKPNSLVQHFFGWEIKTDKKTFDSKTVVLMDFIPTSKKDVHFFYILPFSDKHALIETTHFSKNIINKKVYETELENYIKNNLGIKKWSIKRKENGIIPMYKKRINLFKSFNKNKKENIIHFGLHGNTVKPSTGYSFINAQLQTKIMALNFIKFNSFKNIELRSQISDVFDSIFISFLENRPEMAPSVFMDLFEKVETKSLIKFLSDKPSPIDYVKIINALPKKIFLQETKNYVFNF
tara:strand:- start:213 stop:1379 length:1167 start_codon:yes stop_codon:yes gene_type:complete